MSGSPNPAPAVAVAAPQGADARSDAGEPSVARAGSRVVVKLTLLSLTLFASLLLFVLGIADGNDYALVTRTKHAWLDADAGRKLVFVGGSNLAFGLDSELVENETGLRTVNMGMNGYFGVRFMLQEIKPSLRAGDVVVLAFEHDSFVKSVDGTGWDLLMVAKARPANLLSMTPAQWYEVARAVPFAAQQKLTRLVVEGGNVMKDVIRPRAPEPDAGAVDINVIETAAGFNRRGDLTRHYGVPWPDEREQSYDLTAMGLDPGFVPLLQEFFAQMSARGVHAFMCYSPMLDQAHRTHARAIAAFHRVFLEAFPGRMLSEPEDYVLEEPLFFDTVYHLNERGVRIRSTKLAAQIRAALGG